MPQRRNNKRKNRNKKKMKGGQRPFPIAPPAQNVKIHPSKIPIAPAVKHMGSSQEWSKTQKAGNNKKYILEWFNIHQWLQFSKLFFFIGFIIYIISAFTNTKDGMLVAYYWITIGVAVMLFMTTILVSMNKNISGIVQILQTSLPLIIPALFLLIPLGLLIYIFTVTGPIIARDAELPPAFNKINTFIFVFIMLQTFFLSNFYSSEIKNMKTGHKDESKWVYISGLILATILTTASAAELYVIITSFLTDG